VKRRAELAGDIKNAHEALRKDWSNRGQMSRIILSILRQAAEPLTSRDKALQLLVERALDKSDQRLLRLMTKRVGVAVANVNMT